MSRETPEAGNLKMKNVDLYSRMCRRAASAVSFFFFFLFLDIQVQ